MIILRSKAFADSPENNIQENLNQQMITSRELQIEQMKQQRQLLQTQRLREKIAAQERRDAMKNLTQAQKDAAKENDNDTKNSIKVAKVQNERADDSAKNVSLYKVRSKPVQPVPMKI